MTTAFTADQDAGKLRELDARTRSAWQEYRSSLDELAGNAYEEAERVSWERLQLALHEVADEREQLAGAAPATGEDAA